MTFGGRLRQLRTKKGWSQSELSARSGIAQGSIANLEQDRRAPSLETAEKLAAALTVDVSAFRVDGKKGKRPGRGRPRK